MQEWDEGKELTLARLEDDEKLLMSLVRLQDEGSCFDPLWELYGHNQSLFLTMMDDAEAISLHYFLPLRPSSRINTKKRQILDSWLNDRNTKPRMAANILSMIQDDWDQFTNRWEAVGGFNWLKSVDGFTEYDHGPFMYGLKILAREMYKRVLQRETQNAIQFMLDLPSKSVDLHPQPIPADQVNQKGSETYYLLAAAGSGKTHMTFETLEGEFGFYLVSGAARHQELVSDAGERLYRPRASIVSGDAELLFRTIEPGWKRRLTIHEPPTIHELSSDSESSLIFERRCVLLLMSRLIFFKVVRQADSQVTPWHWLRYQLSCNGNVDPSRKLLRCLIFLGDPNPFDWNQAPLQEWESEYRLLWCFDEVQCDNAGVVTSNPAAISVPDVFPGSTILSSLVAGLVALRGWERGLHPSVLTGTSLNLELVKGAIEEGLASGVIQHFPLDLLFKVERIPLSLNRYPLLSTNEQFKSILEPSIHSVVEVIWDATSPGLTTSESMSDGIRRNLGPSLVGDETIFEDYSWITCLHQRRKVQGPLVNPNMEQIPWANQSIEEIPWGSLNMEQFVQVVTRLFLSDKNWPDIEEESRALRGRYRWSVCFIEELLRTYFLRRELNKKLIIQASKDVQVRAKEPLKRRLNSLAASTDPQVRMLVDDVFQMAMQATLFSRSRVFNSRRAKDLIEQALAYVQEVKEGIPKVRLAELLVVNAVMEYRNLVDSTGSLIDGSLPAWQYSASSFGFIAEDRLAEAIYVHTHESQRVEVRKIFLSKFDVVYPISPQGYQAPRFLGLADFVLERNPGPWAPELDGDGNVGMWLHRVANNILRPPFLLPSQSAGPDITFVLREKVGEKVKRLVCAIQCKVAKKVTVDEGVQNTLDLDWWYNGSIRLKERTNFLGQLHGFKEHFEPPKDEQVEFLSILVLACDENVDMMKIGNDFITKKQDAEFAHNIVWKAEDRKNKLVKDGENPREIEQAESDVRFAFEVKNGIRKTNYYLKVLTNDSVLDVFGPTFHRLLQGMKSEATIS